MDFPIAKKTPKRNLKIGIIIQARMTSKRFPGKSMALLDGKPVIRHVIERALKVNNVHKVILAVPDTLESEPMLQLAHQLGIENFCGSEDNVLDRYYRASIYHNIDVIMRITGDCPLISPKVCDDVLKLALWRRTDYCSNIHPKRTYPKGLDCEIFTLDTLECAHMFSKSDYEKEHVTPWMQNTKDLRTACVSQKIDKSADDWCIDNPGDIAKIEAIIRQVKNVKS
jgi:spore coat polysaccharide biosynthesis protein SpsF (cytidylyltransferase family)